MFKVGDTVVVTYKVTQKEDGWDNDWVRDMDKAIDKQDTIVGIGPTGILLKNNGFRFPPSALKLVPKPHVHAEVIKAWADGATIQVHYGGKTDTWEDHVSPSFAKDFKYRVKPEPKPDRVNEGFCYLSGIGVVNVLSPTSDVTDTYRGNVRFTFDGETGKLKAVELI